MARLSLFIAQIRPTLVRSKSIAVCPGKPSQCPLDLRRATISGGEDWMTMLLQTKAFHKIPPANIQAIFMRMQQINYKAGALL